MELYVFLKLIWFVLLGVLLMGLAIMVGMDMGVGAPSAPTGAVTAEQPWK